MGCLGEMIRLAPQFAELAVATNFSFLRGASHPEEMVARAAELGLSGLGIADRRFGYPVELLDRAGRAKWRIAEIDVAYHPRTEGTRSKVSGSVRGSARAALDFWRVVPR